MAVVTHAHSDHARPGCGLYLTHVENEPLLRLRLGPDIRVHPLRYGESVTRNGLEMSLHPAGHILGSAQVRIEHRGEICVVSGDYKLENDGTCEPFAPIRCHHFVTESTFGLPIFRWRPQDEIFPEIHRWWRANQEEGQASVIFCYSLGKAQRLLRGLRGGNGPIFLHGSIEPFLPAYRARGVEFPETTPVNAESVRAAQGRGLVLAPMSTDNSLWLRRFGEVSTAFASGWMQIRGTRRRRSIERGFVLSDHADWNGLQATIKATGAETVWVTHGYTAPMVRWLRERGVNAEALRTQFHDEAEEEVPPAAEGGAP